MNSKYVLVDAIEYQNFESVKEMDETVRQFNAKISKAHYETLNVLKQYACKVIGVSHLKIETIAKRLNKSVRSIHRHLKYLKDNGFITVANTSRKKTGGKGANFYIISTVEQQKNKENKKMSYRKVSYREAAKNNGQKQSQKALEHIKIKKQTMYSLKLLKTMFSSTRRKQKSNENKRNSERIENIKNATFGNRYVPEKIYRRFNPFFTDKQLTALYKTALKALKYNDLEDDLKLETIIYGLECLVKAMRRYHRKEGGKVQNIYAYLNRTLLLVGFKAEFYGDPYEFTDAKKFNELISN